MVNFLVPRTWLGILIIRQTDTFLRFKYRTKAVIPMPTVCDVIVESGTTALPFELGMGQP